ncbi:MAG: peptide chain release factor N(5)-glutamine methyltransferase [Variovorax sp.]
MPTEPGSVRVAAQLLTAAAAQGVDRLDAQLLVLHALGRSLHDRAWLLAHDTDPLPPAACSTFAGLCARRAAGEPLAYLVGEREFHGLALRVDARVLVPRPDTETLVEWSLQQLAGKAAPSVLDLGTGSGAIALAIQSARPDARVTAVDASAEAWAVARANAPQLGLTVWFVDAEALAGAGAGAGYDLIASNPPYIAAGDPHLSALRHEPEAALVSGHDGLDDIRRIIQAAPTHLSDGGWLLLEHGHDQAGAVQMLLAGRGFADVQSRDDLAGIARCSGGMWRTVK